MFSLTGELLRLSPMNWMMWNRQMHKTFFNGDVGSLGFYYCENCCAYTISYHKIMHSPHFSLAQMSHNRSTGDMAGGMCGSLSNLIRFLFSNHMVFCSPPRLSNQIHSHFCEEAKVQERKDHEP